MVVRWADDREEEDDLDEMGESGGDGKSVVEEVLGTMR